ncbi:hypothetical protein VP1G_00907 [Cytospora mali]|uniref:Uncharacterized protein n=1 Tax=Cytospora mali TaxID=578113 RepID=A0A194UP36_CYTMA|nr:hypothetical protein VP1G_00907 [Valsa mali var. pyri (nom. inval.)]
MQSLLTVNNNVSLLSVTIAPSTFIATLTLSLVFLALYLPPLRCRSGRSTSAATTKYNNYDYDYDYDYNYDNDIRDNTKSQANRFAPYFNNTWWYPYWNRNRAPDPIELRDHPPLIEGLPQPHATLAIEDGLTPRAMPFNPLDHLDASLLDFELDSRSPPPFGYPSTHSGFLKSDTEADLSEMENSTVSAGGYSPPAWRRLGNGDRSSGFWRKGDNLLGYGGLPPQGRRSMESSPEYDSADEDIDDDEILAAAIRTRLPTGSMSPEKERNIRFAVRAEVQQRSEPIEAAINLVRSTYRLVTKSWSSIILSTLIAFMSIAATRALFEPAYGRPVPDLVKVAGIARSFEPLIYYSENGVSQVGDLQATGVAVWDLGESVRLSNLTSAPIIVKELDDLSDSLKTLAIELTKFFANVDGDIDGYFLPFLPALFLQEILSTHMRIHSILIVMDWARRELSQVASLPNAPLTSAFDNIHTILSTAGVLETPTGTPTRLGAIATSVFGMSNPQRTRQTLQRTFNEFLAVLEEAINNELQHSLSLFGLFESIDHQFLNLARTVVRESNAQDEIHADLLSSLWTRILGPKASDVKKYERNRLLLQNVREKTVRNKGILVEHNHKLLALKANLESLRRKLVSPLVRSVNSSTLTVDEQIRGLEDVGIYLEGVRTRQKGKLMEMLYGSGGGNNRQERLIDQTGSAESAGRRRLF